MCGFAKVIALEHPEIWGGLIDLDESAAGGDADELLAEVLGRDGEDHVVIRQGRRLVGRLEAVEEPGLEPVVLRSDGTYLITGGLGAPRPAGRPLARGARRPQPGARRSRRALARSDGSRRHNATVGGERASRPCRCGGRDRDEPRLREAGASMPPLRGVVHAAGVFGHRAIRDMSLDDLLAVLRPRCWGAGSSTG